MVLAGANLDVVFIISINAFESTAANAKFGEKTNIENFL
jgi:hypothetical protein